MEEESGVKAPVTRLRRRLSVEVSEETKSPGPATPTKKRGGRLAAKPQLELIDENTPQNNPKKTTRRSTARDLGEVEEKPLTPSRRSTRIKSNTSILSDTPQAVESPRAKRALRRNSQIGSDTETPTPVTPARTTRARKDSTTSLDKQASATPVTPARIRRTRKDSRSTDDKPAEYEEANRTALINEVISEEPENNLRKSTTVDESTSANKINVSPSSPRKSPRLLAKTHRRKPETEQNDSPIQEADVNMNISSTKSRLDGSLLESGYAKIALLNLEDVVDGTSQSRLSLSSTNILNNINKEPNKKTNINKSTSSLLQIPSENKTKRHRTQSWTPSSFPSKEGSFYSDNESTKNKIKNKSKLFTMRLETKEIEETNQHLKVQEENKEKYLNNSLNKKKKRRSQNSDSDKGTKETSLNQSRNMNSSRVQSPQPSNDNPEGNKENLSHQTSKNPAQHLFEKAPNSSIQSMLFIEDSDTDSLGKTNKIVITESEDQLVPEVEQMKNDELPKESESNTLNIPSENQLFSSLPTTTNNDTCEPMDIDETMPENVSLNDHSGENKSVFESKNESLNETKNKNLQKSLLNISHDASANKSINKSKRKSSLSISVSQDHETTDNGNKSTLILSQIKDLSTGIQDTSKTFNDSRQVNELLSKSLKGPETNKRVANKNISMICLTSTPVQENEEKKLPMQMNTSSGTPHNESKKIATEKKKNLAMVYKSSQPDSSEEGSDDDSEHSNLMVDETEDAGDDYESGDSQDEEERQYERDHEIIDKGVTLTSDDEVSNDSDYEKDSFVVSSDEEDNELLSGSGEDLDMSDNELTISAKSKKKYNERHTKQQKKASREIFQARHRLDKTEQNNGSEVTKKNRQRLDSSLLESGDDAVVPPKKKKRMRLESTMDSSAAKSDADESKPIETLQVEELGAKKMKTKFSSESNSQPSNETDVSLFKNENDVKEQSLSEEIGYKKKKSKRLSESICNESVVNEKEITSICDTTTADDPLKLQIKQEPNTPHRDLDISTVLFTVREEIEQVQVNNDVSIITGNEKSDPLQSSMVQDENDEDDENLSLSENEEITKNYESVLSQLNKNTKPKIKSVDVSLNLNKKEKQKVKHPVIDQLNITETKKSKSENKAKTRESKFIFKKTPASDDDTSSDSIDLKLLFSDDSNDCEKGSSAVQNKNEPEEKNKALKRTEGNTNRSISLNASQIEANDTSFNTSKKKNKRKSVPKENGTIDDADGQTVSYFIDTVGTRNELLNSETTMKKKNKNSSVTFNSYCEVENESKSNTTDSYDAPIEVSNTSLKKKNKLKKVSLSLEKDASNEPGSKDKSTDHLNKTPGTEKKKKADLHEESGKSRAIDSYDDAPVEVSNASMKKQNKLKKVSLTIEQDATNEPVTYDMSTDQPIKTPGTEKNKKKSDKHGKFEKDLSITEAHTHDKSDDKKATMESSSGASNNKENKKRKRLSSAKDEVVYLTPKDSGIIPTANIPNQMNESLVRNSKKKRKLVQNEDIDEKSRKRKEREDDVHDKQSKVLKPNSSDKKQVPRLPITILEQLEDNTKKPFIKTKTPKVVSTTEFNVEETRIRRSKPSNFLEQTIDMNTDSESPNITKPKLKIKKPVVLPFVPTASISDSGFTTKFHITPIPQKIEFVAKKIDAVNFKTDYLNARRTKKIRTYELQRNVKLSKY